MMDLTPPIYDTAFGSLRHYSLEGFQLTESAYAPDCKIPAHAHEEGRFCLVLEGHFAETIGRETLAGTPHTLRYLAPDIPHSASVSAQGGRCFNIEIAPAMMARVRQYAVNLDVSGEYLHPKTVLLAARLYQEFTQSDAVAPIAMEGLALELLAEASRDGLRASEPLPPRWLRQAKELLHAEYSQNLSLEAIAQTVGVHPTHLARTFRQQYRCTVGDYIRSLRLDHARRQLETSEFSLGEIAVEAGFSDQSHFSRLFKRHCGLTPANFRQLSRRG